MNNTPWFSGGTLVSSFKRIRLYGQVAMVLAGFVICVSCVDVVNKQYSGAGFIK